MITASGSDDGAATTTAVLPKLPVSVDTKGRVRVTKEQRRALLGEFARSREPAPQFARRMGLKYSTFAAWVQRYGRPKLPAHKTPVRLLEAVVPPAAARSALWVQLPGGARVELREASQVSLVAALVRALETPC
jgi:hypothetical protein